MTLVTLLHMNESPMDEAARAAAYELADQRFPLIYKLQCPTCQTRNVGGGCLCLDNERTCENGHHMVRCQVHNGYLVPIPPSRTRGNHCFASWLGEGYWRTDKRCACELAPVVWAMWRNAPPPPPPPPPRIRRQFFPKKMHWSSVDWCLVGTFIIFFILSLDYLFSRLFGLR
jgi:hypothetical protein